MKSKLFVVFGLLIIGCILSQPAHAEHEFGLGMVIGDPTGISAKYVLDANHAIDGALGFSNRYDFYMHVTYLWLKPRFFNINQYPVSWYLGIGARLNEDDDDYHYDHHERDANANDLYAGVRVPIGMRMMFNDPRIEVFTELALGMDVIPETDSNFDFGIGGRYYF